MSRPILQSVALASLAASAIGSAEAAPVSPSFDCFNAADPAAGGAVGWGDNVSAMAPTLSFDFFDNSVEPDVSSNLDCSDGAFSEQVVARKAGEGQKDFVKVTLKEVPVFGFAPADTGHIKLNFTQVLGALIDDVQTYDAYWEFTGDYLLGNVNGASTASSNFLGIRLQTTQKFEGLSSFNYDYEQRSLTFSAELQKGVAALSLTSSPRELPEPDTLVLLGTGLLGATVVRRRRRGW